MEWLSPNCYPIVEIARPDMPQVKQRRPKRPRRRSVGNRGSAPIAKFRRPASKEKFWIDRGGTNWLFKYHQKNTGEAWAEKLAFEIAVLVGVDCPRVEFASCVGQVLPLDCPPNLDFKGLQLFLGRVGTITESFLPIINVYDPAEDFSYELFHGNELLNALDPAYDVFHKGAFPDYSVKAVIRAWSSLVGGRSSNPMPLWDIYLKQLASYLLFAGLVSNTDRNHTNWAVLSGISGGDFAFSPAPSFDHASSLGRELQDEKRSYILSSGGMLSYLNERKSAIFVDSRRPPPSPLRLAQLLCRWSPSFTKDAVDRMSSVSDLEFHRCIDRVPSVLMPEISKEFTYQVLFVGREEILRSAKRIR